MLFNSIVFGAFTAFLVDYFLGRFGVEDNARIVISVVAGVIVGFLVDASKVSYF